MRPEFGNTKFVDKCRELQDAAAFTRVVKEGTRFNRAYMRRAQRLGIPAVTLAVVGGVVQPHQNRLTPAKRRQVIKSVVKKEA